LPNNVNGEYVILGPLESGKWAYQEVRRFPMTDQVLTVSTPFGYFYEWLVKVHKDLQISRGPEKEQSSPDVEKTVSQKINRRRISIIIRDMTVTKPELLAVV